jgi:hypothetical protein
MLERLSPEDTARIQEEIAALAIQAAAIDLDGFLEVVAQVSSPQAMAAGINPKAVTSAGDWLQLAMALKPFHEAALERIEQIRIRKEGGAG